jgi:hypothetical protein
VWATGEETLAKCTAVPFTALIRTQISSSLRNGFILGPFEKFVDSPYYSEEDSGTGGFESTNFSKVPRSCSAILKRVLLN